MIKDILQQLAPLDEKIAALRGDPADENMTDITNHAAELAELSAQEDALLSGCGALTAEDRVTNGSVTPVIGISLIPPPIVRKICAA